MKRETAWYIVGVVVGMVLMLILVNIAPYWYYLPPCPIEDSDNCIWDGHVRGNQVGRSFVVIDGAVYYLEED